MGDTVTDWKGLGEEKSQVLGGTGDSGETVTQGGVGTEGLGPAGH